MCVAKGYRLAKCKLQLQASWNKGYDENIHEVIQEEDLREPKRHPFLQAI